MRNKTIFFISLWIFIIFTIAILYFSSILDFLFKTKEEPLIGGERDEYGCLVSAGYSYNETLEVCLREWEFNETKREAIRVAMRYITKINSLTMVEVSESEGLGCFEIKFDILGEQKSLKIFSWNLMISPLL